MNWNVDRMLTKYKAFELDFGIYSTVGPRPLDVRIQWTRQCDHAGATVHMQLLWVSFTISLYDIRHWNYDEGCPE